MNAYPGKTRSSKTRSNKTRSGLFAHALAIGLFALYANAALAAAVAPMVPATATPAVPTVLTEAQKIQMLIHNIEVMKDARFVRNGSDYDGAAAADHLRTKLNYAGSRIKTAQDFISYLATGSSISGKPYLIRFSDGREVESAVYFHTMLAKIEHPVVALSKPLPPLPAAKPVPIAAVPIAAAPIPLPATTQALTESQRIQSLIHDMELQKGAHFVRDGRNYSVAQGARYLRAQLRRAGKHITSAQDFITNFASRGPSGQANRIRFANGREMDAGQFFRTRLAMIEHSATAIRPIPAASAPPH